MVDPMFEIPKNRKAIKLGRVCLLMGLTVLLFLWVAGRPGLGL